MVCLCVRGEIDNFQKLGHILKLIEVVRAPWGHGENDRLFVVGFHLEFPCLTVGNKMPRYKRWLELGPGES